MDEPERPGPDRWRWRRRRWPRWDLRWWLIRKSTANGFSIIRFQLVVWWPGRALTRRGHLTFLAFGIHREIRGFSDFSSLAVTPVTTARKRRRSQDKSNL